MRLSNTKTQAGLHQPETTRRKGVPQGLGGSRSSSRPFGQAVVVGQAVGIGCGGRKDTFGLNLATGTRVLAWGDQGHTSRGPGSGPRRRVRKVGSGESDDTVRLSYFVLIRDQTG